MGKHEALAELAALVAEFERLDSRVGEELSRNNWSIIAETLAAKKAVKRFLAHQKPLQVEPGLALKLKKIRDNYGYSIDSVLKGATLESGDQFSQEIEYELDYVQALFTEGTADYVDRAFFTRRNQVGTIVVSESLPEHFVHHLKNLRECYSLGLFEATTIYCRAVIEAGCFEALRRRGEIRLDGNMSDLREFRLRALMRSIKGLVSASNWDRADSVIRKADLVLHSKREKVLVTQEEACAFIRDTFALVEELFSAGHRTARRR